MRLMLVSVNKSNHAKKEQLRGGHQGQPGPTYPTKHPNIHQSERETCLPSGTGEEWVTGRGSSKTRDISKDVTKLQETDC